MPSSALTGLRASLLALCLLHPAGLSAWAADLSKIDTIVVLYPENRSFDHLYGLFPGANGIAKATKEQYTQRDHDGSVAALPAGLGRARQARSAISGAAERAVPDRCAAGRAVGRPGAAEPHPRLLPQHRADQRRPQRHVRGHVDRRRLDHGLLRRQRHEAVAVGEGVHARRQLLHGRVRRLLSQSPVPDLRLHARLQGRADGDARPARCRRQAREEAGLALRPRWRRAHLYRRPGGAEHARWLLRQHHAAAVSAERHPARRGRRTSELADAKGTERLGPAAAAADRPRPSATHLSAKGISWAWYAGGWNAALADGRRPAGREARRSSTPARTRLHQFPAAPSAVQLLRAVRAGHGRSRSSTSRTATTFCATSMPGRLPSVVFYKPVGRFNQHPSYTDLLTGDAHIADILERLRRGPQWSRHGW